MRYHKQMVYNASMHCTVEVIKNGLRNERHTSINKVAKRSNTKWVTRDVDLILHVINTSMAVSKAIYSMLILDH